MKPKVIQIEGEDHRCFTNHQYKAIVSKIAKEQYCDSLENFNLQTIKIQDSLISSYKGKEVYLRGVIQGQETMINMGNALSSALKSDLKIAQHQTKIQKRRTTWAIIASGILGILLIVK